MEIADWRLYGMWLVDFGLKIALFAEILTEILSYIQKRAKQSQI
jgi:hypothetical protein